MDKWVKRWSVESDSNPSKSYTVAIDGEGNWGCSCPAWTRSKQMRKDCKHIRRVKAQTAPVAPAPTVVAPQRTMTAPQRPRSLTLTRAGVIELD